MTKRDYVKLVILLALMPLWLPVLLIRTSWGIAIHMDEIVAGLIS
jgi:uncharacterized membrane protein (DUF485 family)